MPLPENHSVAERHALASTNSIASTPLPAVVVAPFTGRMSRVAGVAHGTFTGDCSVAVSIVRAVAGGAAPGSGTALSGSPMILTAANSAAGTSVSLNPGAFAYVTDGDLITFTPSGSTGTNIGGTFSASFKRA